MYKIIFDLKNRRATIWGSNAEGREGRCKGGRGGDQVKTNGHKYTSVCELIIAKPGIWYALSKKS